MLFRSISPDLHPDKNLIIDELKKIPGLKIQIINKLTYNEYKHLISMAKWSLTLGEGLDGYFIEPIFSGAISFAIFNDEFFTSDFRNLSTIYKSTEELIKKIKFDIIRLNEENQAKTYQDVLFKLCSYYYNSEKYVDNLRRFYLKEYTYA